MLTPSWRLTSEASPHKRWLKCDTNISPRRLITHLLHQMVHYHTNRRGSGHWSATITRDNKSTTSHTKMSTKSKIASKSCTIRSFLWRPRTTGKVGCRTITYSTSSGMKSGSSSEAKPQIYNGWVQKYSTSPTPSMEGVTQKCTGKIKDKARVCLQ